MAEHRYDTRLTWADPSAAREGVVVASYADGATATMRQEGMGGRFSEVVLHPEVVVAEESTRARAEALRGPAHEACFITSSVNFPVRHEARVSVTGTTIRGGAR